MSNELDIWICIEIRNEKKHFHYLKNTAIVVIIKMEYESEHKT